VFHEISRCCCCGGERLERYLSLGDQPLANQYVSQAVEQARFPLNVNVCLDCFHSQLSVRVDPEDLFRDYLYVSGTTETFRAHCAALAKDAVATLNVENPVALDIACNDGTLLECFRALGCRVMGVDPAQNLRAITEEKGIDVIVDFWNEEVAGALPARPNIITATNVLAHTADPYSFLVAARKALAEGGVILVEFPYSLSMFTEAQFDQVYHEHISYFSVGSFRKLARRAGLRIENLTFPAIHGGSSRYALTAGSEPDAAVVDEAVSREAAFGIDGVALYRGFQATVETRISDLTALMSQMRSAGYKIVAYGASAKGNTVLNFANCEIDYIVDDNALKVGMLTPGRHIPIRATSTLSEEPGRLCILLLAWNFFEEIKKRVGKLRSDKTETSFLAYVPKVTVC